MMALNFAWRRLYPLCALARPFALLGVACSGVGTAQVPVVPDEGRAPEVRLSGDRVVMPFVMVGDYPFVEGEVAGVKGKFMLDTGMGQALALNDHRVSLSGGTEIGTSFFGSGQRFSMRLNEKVSQVRLGKLRFPQVTKVQSQDATQLEGITPDFLGWIGYYAWKGYSLEMDYDKSRAIFHKGPPSTYLNGGKIVGVLPFELRKLPNDPLISIRIGDVDATLVFDTGQYGAIHADEATKAHLLSLGAIKAGRDAGSVDLQPFDVGGVRMAEVRAMPIETSRFPPASSMGITTRTVVTFGFGFLRQFRTVWDFRNQRIYLLAR